jgi:hypothetical protein
MRYQFFDMPTLMNVLYWYRVEQKEWERQKELIANEAKMAERWIEQNFKGLGVSDTSKLQVLSVVE